MQLTPPSSLHLLITENQNNSSDDYSSDKDTSNKDEDTTTTAANEDSTEANGDDTDANDDPFSTRGRKAASKKSGGRKTTGETINYDTPPEEKAAHLRRALLDRYIINSYAHLSKNKIDVMLHKGGMPSKDAQPQVSLLLGGKTLSVHWKTLEKLFSKLRASVQGIAGDSSGFVGYSNAMQEMMKAGVVITNGYYSGPPQIIKLDMECTGNPKVKIRPVLTKETVLYKGKQHCQIVLMTQES